ncbi:MAG: single-stranded DNA-binding protein [Lachnospiraceae bacterium]|nr:single-stranded DNA-binding protein [Lachnospiraceae bacterium]
MNKVILMGRLTRDPDVRYTQTANSSAIGRFSIAVDRRFKREGQPEADFFNCTAFGKLGEFVEKYLKKGTKIVVVGSVQNDNYTDKDGNQRYSVQIICDEIEFAESKNAQGGGQDYQGGSSSGNNSNNAPSATADAGDGFIMNSPTGMEDELPFN